MYKEKNKYQVFMDPGKIHKNGRVPKIATLQKSEALVLNVPPQTEGENHRERFHVGYGSRVRSRRGAEGSSELARAGPGRGPFPCSGPKSGPLPNYKAHVFQHHTNGFHMCLHVRNLRFCP